MSKAWWKSHKRKLRCSTKLRTSEGGDELTSGPMPLELPGRCFLLPLTAARMAFVREERNLYREVAEVAMQTATGTLELLTFRARKVLPLEQLLCTDAPIAIHGTQIWPAGVALADYLLAGRGPSIVGRRVHELGCGFALPSLAAARRAAKGVLASDLPGVIEDLKAGLPPEFDHVEFAHWNWEDCTVPPSSAEADLLLCADCVYAPLYKPTALLRALIRLRKQTLLAVERRPSDGLSAFLEGLRAEGFTSTQCAHRRPLEVFGADVEIWLLDPENLQ